MSWFNQWQRASVEGNGRADETWAIVIRGNAVLLTAAYHRAAAAQRRRCA